MILLFDIGGTKMRSSFSRDGKELAEPVTVPTPQDSFEEAKKIFSKIAGRLPKTEKLKAVVAGVAGPLDKERTMLVNSPHIQGWIKKPLKAELERTFSAPAYLENDTALVGLGEAVRGAAKGYSIAAYITVSTGVGGVRLVDQRIDCSAYGFEPGHQIIDAGGRMLCPGPGCNMQGHLEGYVSGTAVERRYQKDPTEIDNPKAWDELARLLAVGLNNTVVHWSPEVVVLGGSMILGTPCIPWETLECSYKETVKIFPEPPPLKKGELGDWGGLYGALELARGYVSR